MNVSDSAAKSTREFAIRSVLITYCGLPLTPELIEEITKSMIKEITDSPTAWAFTNRPKTLLLSNHP